jgi:hypothetical protein
MTQTDKAEQVLDALTRDGWSIRVTDSKGAVVANCPIDDPEPASFGVLQFTNLPTIFIDASPGRIRPELVGPSGEATEISLSGSADVVGPGSYLAITDLRITL